MSEAPIYGINQSANWDDYVASWSDDWQPLLGMNANGQELLDLLGNSSILWELSNRLDQGQWTEKQ